MIAAIRAKRLSLGILTFCMLFALAAPSFVHAEIKKEFIGSDRVYGDFVVGPGKNEVTVEPGTSKTIFMTVTNRMGTERKFNLSVEDFTGSQDPSQPIVLLGNERGPYSLRDYIHLETNSFVLKQDERAVVPVTITVPVDAEPGGRYGSVLVSTASLPSEDKASGIAPIISRVGSLVFVTVPGEAKQEGALEEFGTKEGSVFLGGPIDFVTLYRNDGNIYLNPYGVVSITNTFGQNVGEIEVKPWFAMPNSLRSREFSWDKKVLFGRYTATLSLNRGYDNIVDTQKVVFYVFPLKYILTILGSLFIIIFAVYFVFSRFEFKRK
ncbi:MAG: hypothetical protein RLY57_49 [Candidatus Parcubacteria bacterium]|jgi:hypothetical protein